MTDTNQKRVLADGSDMNAVVLQYRELRDEKARITKQATADKDALQDDMSTLAGLIMQKMKETNQKTIVTDSGTAYTETKNSVKVYDWEKCLGYIKENDRFDLLNAAVGKKAVIEDIEVNGGKLRIPGIDVKSFLEVVVRKS